MERKFGKRMRYGPMKIGKYSFTVSASDRAWHLKNYGEGAQDPEIDVLSIFKILSFAAAYNSAQGTLIFQRPGSLYPDRSSFIH